jgi:Mitochondrial carrier protein
MYIFSLPVGVKTLCASAAAAGWRIVLMPVDTCKTIMQVEGKHGFSALKAKFRTGGPTVLYHGALAASAATFVGHYPCKFQQH